MPRQRKRREEDPQAPASRDADKEAKSVGKGSREYSELVLLVHATNLAEAELFKAELEAHGIPAILEGEGAPIAVTPGAGAGVPVLVPEEFADQAAELIAELESAKPEGNALAEKEDLFDEEEDLDEDVDDDIEDIDEEDDLDDTDLDEEEDLDEDEDADDDADEEEEWEEDEEEEEEEWEDDAEDDEDDEEEWDDEDS